MGASEFIPFATRSGAELFTLDHGGSIVPFAEISDAALLAPEEVELSSEANMPDSGS